MDYEQRTKEIVNMRESGMTYSQIGKQFSISSERVRQIIVRHEFRTKIALKMKEIGEANPFYYGFSHRTYTILCRNNISSEEDVYKIVDAGEDIPHLSAKSIRELNTKLSKPIRRINSKHPLKYVVAK